MTETPPSGAQRITIVHGGTAREYWADEWQIVTQDDGKTMKCFAVGGGTKAQAIRDEALAKELNEASHHVLSRLPDNPYRVDLNALQIGISDHVVEGGLEVRFTHGPSGTVGVGGSTSEAWLDFKKAIDQ